jgi:small subunit ribosomal protein S24e
MASETTVEIEIVTSKENPLLKRREVQFRVEHGPQSKTPGRLDVRKALAVELKLGEELVFVKDMRTLTGTGTAVGHANVYETAVQAKIVEPKYIVKRNSPPEKPKEEAVQ